MSPGLTMERVYEALKIEIMTGVRTPGAKLDPGKLALDLNASATPVRDALHRLMAERIVDAWPQEGFHAAMPTEAGLRDLYGWSLDVLLAAVRSTGASTLFATEGDSNADETTDLAVRTRILFEQIATLSGNLEHREAMRGINDRIHLVRLFESYLIDDLEDELHSMLKNRRCSNLPELRRKLRVYHRRREKIVPQLIALVRQREIWPKPD